MLQPYNITLHIYAESQQEANELQDTLRNFVIDKYSQGVYPRASSLSNLVKRYGNSAIINNFIK